MGHKEVPVTQLRKRVLEELERRNYSKAEVSGKVLCEFLQPPWSQRVAAILSLPRFELRLAPKADSGVGDNGA